MIDAASYLQMVAWRLQSQGFGMQYNVPGPRGAFNLVAARSGVEATKFGNQHNWVFVTEIPGLTIEAVRLYSADCFTYAAAQAGGVRGLGTSLTCYSVIVTSGLADGVRQQVESQSPAKHWGAFEFPAVVDLALPALACYQKTPMWGAAYIGGFRRNAQAWFTPAAGPGS